MVLLTIDVFSLKKTKVPALLEVEAWKNKHRHVYHLHVDFCSYGAVV